MPYLRACQDYVGEGDRMCPFTSGSSTIRLWWTVSWVSHMQGRFQVRLNDGPEDVPRTCGSTDHSQLQTSTVFFPLTVEGPYTKSVKTVPVYLPELVSSDYWLEIERVWRLIHRIQSDASLRRGGMKKHWMSKHKDRQFPYEKFPNYGRPNRHRGWMARSL